jgi:methyltransferase (TIGR00027 family)
VLWDPWRIPLRHASRTAVLSAVGRALHLDGRGPYVFRDDLALPLAGETGVAVVNRLRAELSDTQLLSFSRWTSLRARFVEDAVEQAIAAGIRQYVILGAGLDSFAYRRHELVTSVRVFEVDQADSQEWKQRRLGELKVQIPPSLAFVPVDFERETLDDGLRRAGFDSAQPAFLSWIGVTMYLGFEAVEVTLRSIASFTHGTRIVLTYDVPADALSGLQREVRDAISRVVSQLGEPFVTAFEPREIESLLLRFGFQDIAHYAPADLVARYLDREDEARIGGPQRLLTATVP